MAEQLTEADRIAALARYRAARDSYEEAKQTDASALIICFTRHQYVAASETLAEIVDRLDLLEGIRHEKSA